jgi:hypothetical protein
MKKAKCKMKKARDDQPFLDFEFLIFNWVRLR